MGHGIAAPSSMSTGVANLSSNQKKKKRKKKEKTRWPYTKSAPSRTLGGNARRGMSPPDPPPNTPTHHRVRKAEQSRDSSSSSSSETHLNPTKKEEKNKEKRERERERVVWGGGQAKKVGAYEVCPDGGLNRCLPLHGGQVAVGTCIIPRGLSQPIGSQASISIQ